MEGPSIVILREQVQMFQGKEIIAVSGNSTIDQSRLAGQKVSKFRSYGKHFLVCFSGFFLRVHFLMFGSYRINEQKDRPPRLSLQFKNGELNLYSCAIKLVEEDPDKVYDWQTDVLSESWSPAKATRKLKKMPGLQAGDALLDQEIFAGVGNIIKNEVLFRVKIHPETLIGALPPKALKALVNAASDYSYDFYDWKKIYSLKKHWLVYNKKMCPRCDIPIIKKHTGATNRRSFFCENCQLLYIPKQT